MLAGKLDRFITIEQPTESITAQGEVTQAWATLASVWAQYQPLNSTERFAGDAARGVFSAKFNIRYRSDVTEKMRIYFNARRYRILGINEIGRREGLQIISEAIA